MKVYDKLEDILRKDLLKKQKEVSDLESEIQSNKSKLETRTLVLILVSVYAVLVTFNLFL